MNILSKLAKGSRIRSKTGTFHHFRIIRGPDGYLRYVEVKITDISLGIRMLSINKK